METLTHLSLADEPPLSFEDLPDQAIGIILGKLWNIKDKVRLTQASPSARRLSRGPNCELGVFGEVHIKFEHREEPPKRALFIGYSRNFDLNIFWLGAVHPDYPLALDYLAARSKAFSKVAIDTRNGNLDETIRLLDALYSQGACCPVSIKINGLRSDAAQALVSHWLTVSEGTHSPRDRSLFVADILGDFFHEYDERYIEFVNGLRGIGELKLEEGCPASSWPDGLPLPALPHLADCLEKLNVIRSGFRPDLGPCNLTALREVVLRITPEGAGFTPGPPGSLHRFFAPCANSLESVRLHITRVQDKTFPISLEPFAVLRFLKRFRLELAVCHSSLSGVFTPVPSESEVLLPSLESLSFSARKTPSNTLSILLSNFSAPNLRVLDYYQDLETFDSQRVLDLLFLSNFPVLEDIRVTWSLSKNKAPDHSILFGDLSGLIRLRGIFVEVFIDTTNKTHLPAITFAHEDALPPQLKEVESMVLIEDVPYASSNKFRSRWTAAA